MNMLPDCAGARARREAGTLEQAGFKDGFFDVVTLWDVLEHLHDPAEV